MNQPFTHTHEHAMHMWEKCSDDCRKLLATQAKLLAACKATVTLFAPGSKLPPDIQESFRRMVEEDPVLMEVRAAIAEAEGDAE